MLLRVMNNVTVEQGVNSSYMCVDVEAASTMEAEVGGQVGEGTKILGTLWQVLWGR